MDDTTTEQRELLRSRWLADSDRSDAAGIA
jgi:hypothetical protein